MSPHDTRFSTVRLVAAGMTAVAAASIARAACDVQISPSRDNTIYSESAALSNGAGDHFFAGRNGASDRRRGLIAFDILGPIPAGSTIASVSLRLHMSQGQSGDRTVRVLKLAADWGEGTSHAPMGEGIGAGATSGDATWDYRFYDSGNPPASPAWSTPGGDIAGASAVAVVNSVGYYTWSSTPQLVADVQAWLDTPTAADGWILIGDETVASTAKRFDSRTNPVAALRPVLTVRWVPECPTDTDRDDVVGVEDLLDVLGAWGQCKFGFCCDADTDGDTSVDVNDLLNVLADWGPCS